MEIVNLKDLKHLWMCATNLNQYSDTIFLKNFYHLQFGLKEDKLISIGS